MTEVASLAVRIGADITALTRGLGEAQQNIGAWVMGAGKAVSSFGTKAQSVGSSMVGMSQPFVDAIMGGLGAASDMEGIMKQLEIMGGLSADQLQVVSDKALQLGADTMFSASDAAGAMLELVKAGMSVNDAMIAIDGSMAGAAAGGVSLEQMAGITAMSLAQFKLEASDSADVANILAAAAVASSADVADLADGLANVGPVASQAGLGFGEAAAALAVLANNGIQGAEAGTQLKSLLLNLNSDTAKDQLEALGVSMYDAAGNTRDFDTVLDEIQASLSTMTPEEQAVAMKNLAGSYGITALSALLAAGGIDQMQLDMGKVPSAAELAQGAADTFAGKVDSLKGSVETLSITALTPLMDALGDLAVQVTPIVNDLTDWAAKNPELITGVTGLVLGVSVLGGGLMILGSAASLVGGGLSVMGGAITFLTGPVGLLVLGIGALGALLTNPGVQSALATWPENFRMLGNIISTSVTNAVDTAKAKFDELIVGIRGVVRDIEASWLTLQVDAAKVQVALGINVSANEQFINETTDTTDLMDIAKKLETSLNNSLAANGPLNLNIPGFEWLMTTNDLVGNQNAVEALASQIVDPNAIQEAINAAIASSDLASVKTLLPLSLELADDPRVQMQTLLTEALANGGTTGEAFNALLPMATELDINVLELVTQYQSAADDAAGAKTYPVEIAVGVTLVPVSVDSSQIAAVVTLANGAAAVPGGEIPQLATGGYIQSEGLAYLHAGERVLTRDETDNYGRPTDSGGRYTFNITTYGSSPYEVAQMVQQAIAEAGV